MGIAPITDFAWLSPLVVVAMPVAICALLKKAGELKNQPEGFSHRAKRIWCYILAVACGLIESDAIVMLASSIRHNIYGSNLVSFLNDLQNPFMLLSFFGTIFAMLLPLAAIGIWWKSASRKELLMEQPAGYEVKVAACITWIKAFAAFFVAGIVLLIAMFCLDAVRSSLGQIPITMISW